MKSAPATSSAMMAVVATTRFLIGDALLPAAPRRPRAAQRGAHGLPPVSAIAAPPLRVGVPASSVGRRRRRADTSLFGAATATAVGTAAATPPPPPREDGAATLPQLMTSLWRLIAHATAHMHKGESATVLFPGMTARLGDARFVAQVLGHLDACKDVCDDFGVNTVLVPCVEQGDTVVRGFTAKSYRNAGAATAFAPDPFWDDDQEWDSGDEDDKDAAAIAAGVADAATPADDDAIVALTRTWVDRMMADLALCPFTQSSSRSGIPAGPVRYQVDRVVAPEDAYAAYWSEVCRVEAAPERELSTTLHILPEFGATNVELFEQWADTLTGTLESLGVEELLQLIFFHPQWIFRDGGDRSGEAGEAANYARRSPWPMVNILRTKQVRLAQKGIPTGLVYQQNEKTLSKIGTTQLEEMLRLRQWSDVEGMKVDRKDMEALRVANDLQVAGVVNEQDTTFAFDSTPAANRVTKAEAEGGNMVNVVLQALEIRLGKTQAAEGADARPAVLTGAQTSAAMMASDFLFEELERIEDEAAAAAARVEREGVRSPGDGSGAAVAPARGGYAAAYGFDDDYDDIGYQKAEAAEMSALFGGGIPMTSGD